MPRKVPRTSVNLLLLLSIAAPTLGQPTDDKSSIEWRHYGADRATSKYSPANQIGPENFSSLKPAWTWSSPDSEIDTSIGALPLKGTPLMIGDTLYAVSSYNLIVALDPTTGEERWRYDPKGYDIARPTHGGFSQRGLDSWNDGRTVRIILGTGAQQLVAVDALTGEPIGEFGNNGIVDMRADIGTEEELRQTGLNSPPMVCGETIVVGMVVNDFPNRQKWPAGHVRGYDARTGKKKWVFHTVPQAGEFGNDTSGRTIPTLTPAIPTSGRA